MSTTPPVDCVSLFEAEGIPLVVGGNSPILLNEPDAVYLLRSGRLEVFSVGVEDGQARGTRHHFFTAIEGDALFGMDCHRHGEGQALLAVGVVGTRLLKLDQTRLRACVDLPGIAHTLAPILDRWVMALSTGVTRTIVPHPRADLQIEAESVTTVASGQLVRARKAVSWVRHVEGQSLFIGMEELADMAPGTNFPLASTTWLQALGPVTLSSVDTVTALTESACWKGLDALYGVLFRCEFLNVRLATADELNRLREKSDRDRRVSSDALDALAGVMSSRRAAFAGVPIDDPLVAACVMVGRALGIEIREKPRPKDDEPPLQRLDAILRASRVRSRKVRLSGNWWAEESWPMLAFVEPAGGGAVSPVAILRHAGHFVLHDPATRRRVRVTGDVAATLSGDAVSFYRPFPHRSLKPLDLTRFGLHGAAFDVVRPILVGVCGGLLAMVPPFLTGLLVDTVIPEAARSHLVQIAIVLVVVALTTTSFDIVRNLSALRLEARMSAVVQPAMWDRLLSLPMSFFRRFTAGDLAQRANAIDAIRQAISGAAVETAMTSLFSLFLLVQLFYYSWPLAILGTGLVLLAVAGTLLVGYLKLPHQRDVIALEGRISGLVLQLLSGISRLRVAGAEGRAFAEWAHMFARKKTLALRAGMIDTWLATGTSMFTTTSGMLIFWVLQTYLRGPDGGMSAGHFIAFNIAFGTFLGQMLQLSYAAISVLWVVPLYERAKPILEALPEVDHTRTDPVDLTGRIDIDHLSFRYQADGPLILNDVSMHIGAGEYVAIVGLSGSGKSTLFRLLLGLDSPTAGAIYFDGADLAQLDVAKIRRRIGTVLQNGRIRDGSILHNILGSAPLTADDAWEAARLAGFDQDVKEMPMGMQTMLQQGGLTLSGGQRQRLIIARAIVTRPRILLFDEATSALDNRTQAIVSRSLQDLQATRVAIAHRLSTIRGADRIYVLEGGRLAQIGTYDELEDQPGLFARLISRQQA